MGRRIRKHDWSGTLGPPESWPLALREALGICLHSSFPTAIYWGRELRLIYNDAWAPLAGDKHPWALGRRASEVWPDIWHVIEPQLKQVLKNGRGVSFSEQMLPMRRGDRIDETYWDYSFTPIFDEHGKVVGVFSQGNDVTERTRTEAALRRSEAALREADRRKNEFLATLAHELRNPLSPILNATRMIELVGSADPRLMKAANIVVRQVGTMARLVDDLLDVSRITRGRIELRIEPVDIETIVSQAVESAEPLIAEKGHTLDVELPDEPVVLDVDPVRISQALLNIVNNAARYTPPGGSISIRAVRDDARIRISVSDTGIGIARDTLDKIFDLFTQAKPSSGASASGLGIGLHLARGLVALHGGKLTAHSDGPGRGSEFVLDLPARVERPLKRSAESTGLETTQ